VALGSVLMYFIGWFPFGAALVGLITIYIVQGRIIRRFLLTLLSAAIGLGATLIVLTYGGYLAELGLSSNLFLTAYGLYIISTQILLVFIGSIVTLLSEKIFNP